MAGRRIGRCVKERRLNSPQPLSESAHQALRSATRESHAVVDAAFSRFDLTDPASYRQFLLCHARIVPAIERWLDMCQPPELQAWSRVRRTPGLLADIRALDLIPPTTLPIAFEATDASIAGVTYVLEGSRLGSSVLARRVDPSLPKAYLASPSQSGLWRRFLKNLDMALPTSQARRDAGIAARAVFDRFCAASDQATAA